MELGAYGKVKVYKTWTVLALLEFSVIALILEMFLQKMRDLESCISILKFSLVTGCRESNHSLFPWHL